MPEPRHPSLKIYKENEKYNRYEKRVKAKSVRKEVTVQELVPQNATREFQEEGVRDTPPLKIKSTIQCDADVVCE